MKMQRAGGVAPGLLYAIAGVAAFSAGFYYRQNVSGQVGGPISVEKILWLNYTLTAWFVVPAFLARHPGLDPALRTIIRCFLASMLVRAAVELPLIYVTFGWSPIYGIAHDVFNIVMIAVLRVAYRDRLARLDPFNREVRRFCAAVQLALVAEIVFAALFYRMGVHREAVYYAPPTEAFRHINLLTRWVDVAVYAHLAFFLWRGRRRVRIVPTSEPAAAPVLERRANFDREVIGR
jgi:hypothetical protein